MINVSWKITTFDELDIHTLYAILKLRNEVFVVEQNCVYQDVDSKDQLAFHLLGFVGTKLVAYCRLFYLHDKPQYSCIGRVIVDPSYRKLKIGHQLLDEAIEVINELFNTQYITISAQLHLEKFYESHGFSAISDVYLEDGIPHIRMERNNITYI